MHVHMHATLDLDPSDTSAETWFTPQFVSNGITGVRSMFDDLTAIAKLRGEIGSGRIAGPRIVASGPILDGERPFWHGFIACANAGQAREAVWRLKRDGADFVKVYNGLSREAYLAIAAEAKAAGMSFAGHTPNSVTIAEASDAGQKSIEHLDGLLRYLGDTDDPAKTAALFSKFVKNGTWMTPTLVVLHSAAYFGDAALTNDPRMKSVPSPVQDFWRAGGGGMRPSDESARQRFERELRLVDAMHRAGVKILAGTDTPNPYVYPGASLHDELEWLLKAGLSPLDALRAATIRPAEYLGLADRLGSIAVGKFADLVLLDGDPLVDIANTRRVSTVVVNGRVLK